MTLRVAVVGAGPAGIYAADILTKSEVDVSVDLFERLPAPFGLVRYGVAPDHPRIKEIIKALQRVLAKPEVRFIGNVDYGTDVKLEELREFYDAVIFSTGAMADRDLRIPGEDLKRSYGAADFVSWYDSHPDVPQTWDFGNGTHAAVIGVGNVALDVARVLAKTADEMLVTDIPSRSTRASPRRRSPTSTSSRAAARRTRSSRRWSCASSTTPPTSRSSSTPRASRSTTTRWSTSPSTRPTSWCSTSWPTGWAATSRASRTASTSTSWRRPRRSSARTARSSACAPSAPSWSATDPCVAPASSPTGPSSRSTARWATPRRRCWACPSTSASWSSPTRVAACWASTATTCPTRSSPAGSSADRSA
ncbi:FAD-dependent oxidoreductase [Nocardioides daphniae]|uniref:FAD-dependent oxidoreductase n=1 Tax=Nocardioides daphniae TaxID=402297 RepID=UPI001EE953E9|nr:FAD-dependent oxidoreductase [Nocardioides daphniae]